MSAIGSLDNTTSTVRLTVAAYDNNSSLMSAKTYVIPAGTLAASSSEGATTALGLFKGVGGSQDSDRILTAVEGTGEGTPYLVGAAAGGYAQLSASFEILNDAGTYVAASALQAVDKLGAAGTASSTDVASGVSIVTSGVAYKVQSLWPGEGYNAGTRSDGTTSGVSFEVGVIGGTLTFETINNLGTAAESAKAGTVSSAFLEDVIGTTYATRTSNSGFCSKSSFP